MIFFLTKLGSGNFFQKSSFEIQVILQRSLFQNTQKSAVVKKLGSGKIDFSTCYRPQIIFLMILIDSPELFGLRKTPNSKSRFFGFLDTLTPKRPEIYEKSLIFANFENPKNRKSALKTQILTQLTSKSHQKFGTGLKFRKLPKI